MFVCVPLCSLNNKISIYFYLTVFESLFIWLSTYDTGRERMTLTHPSSCLHSPQELGPQAYASHWASLAFYKTKCSETDWQVFPKVLILWKASSVSGQGVANVESEDRITQCQPLLSVLARGHVLCVPDTTLKVHILCLPCPHLAAASCFSQVLNLSFSGTLGSCFSDCNFFFWVVLEWKKFCE